MPRKPHKSTHKQFQHDLIRGKTFEQQVARTLETQGYLTQLPVEDRVWDLEIKKPDEENWSKVEIKCDFKAVITGNVAFETAYRGGPSGISLNNVDYWVHGVGDTKAYMIPFKLLIKTLTRRFKEFRFMEVLGDGSSGILVPITEFEKFEGIVPFDIIANEQSG